MSLAYRRATADDLPMIVETWSDNYRCSRSAGLVSMDDWDDIMPGQIRKILARPGVEAFVACHPEETDHVADLYGWIAVERGYEVMRSGYRDGRHVRSRVTATEPLIHYVYVKKGYRKMGLARGLFKAAGITDDQFNYTCRTAIVSHLAAKIPRARWEHLVARFPKQ